MGYPEISLSPNKEEQTNQLLAFIESLVKNVGAMTQVATDTPKPAFSTTELKYLGIIQALDACCNILTGKITATYLCLEIEAEGMAKKKQDLTLRRLCLFYHTIIRDRLIDEGETKGEILRAEFLRLLALPDLKRSLEYLDLFAGESKTGFLPFKDDSEIRSLKEKIYNLFRA